jgi:hypothetical protein
VKRRSALIGLLALGSLLIVVLIVGRGPERHADGQGALASRNQPGSETMAINPKAAEPGTTSWTYGLRLCLARPDQPATIESIGPTKSLGAGYRFLGALVRSFTPTATDTPIISTHPYPPPASVVPDVQSSAVGTVIDTPCSDDGQGVYTELLIGLELTGPEGGGWQGIDIGYTAAGQRHVVGLEHDLFICGSALPDRCVSDPPP